MQREEAIKRMRDNWGQISLFGVRSLALFGSLARDEAGSGSDADILVEFRGPATFDRYMDLKIFLEELLGCPVDLVTCKAIKPRMRTYVVGGICYGVHKSRRPEYYWDRLQRLVWPHVQIVPFYRAFLGCRQATKSIVSGLIRDASRSDKALSLAWGNVCGYR